MQWRYRPLAKELKEGAVIAYPTEGVWGLGCHPLIEAAVRRILALKGRAWEKGLIIAAGDLDLLEPYMADVNDQERAVLLAPQEYPTTFLVPRSALVPDWLAGDSDKIAIRISSHPVIQGITRELKAPIVSTSANPAGKPSAENKLRVLQYFEGQIDAVVPGELGGATGASQIKDLKTGEVIRGATN